MVQPVDDVVAQRCRERNAFMHCRPQGELGRLEPGHGQEHQLAPALHRGPHGPFISCELFIVEHGRIASACEGIFRLPA